MVLVLIAIGAAFVIPNYQRSIERQKGYSAQANLLAIYNAQKRYRLDYGEYYACAGIPNPPGCTIATINEALELQINPDPNFDYRIVPRVDLQTGYTATAKRRPPDTSSGYCDDEIMTITDIDSNVIKGCAVW